MDWLFLLAGIVVVAIVLVLLEIFDRHPDVAVAVKITFEEGGEGMFRLHNDKPANAALSFVDSEGVATEAPASVVATWSTSDPAVLRLTPSADTLSCQIDGDIPAGTTAQAQLQVSVDVGGAAPLTGQADVEVVPGAASSVEIQLTEAPGVKPRKKK